MESAFCYFLAICHFINLPFHQLAISSTDIKIKKNIFKDSKSANASEMKTTLHKGEVIEEDLYSEGYFGSDL
jgi:hypothetical protein